MMAGKPTLALWVVKIGARRRAHLLAQIVQDGVPWEDKVLWQAETTVCGLTGWENYSGSIRQFCRGCSESKVDRWAAAPLDLRASVGVISRS